MAPPQTQTAPPTLKAPHRHTVATQHRARATPGRARRVGVADTEIMAPNLIPRRSRDVRSRKSNMTPAELVETLDRLGVPKRLARHIGVNQRTVSRWCAGGTSIPASVPWVLAAYVAWPWTRRLRGPLPVRFGEWFQRSIP